MYCTCYRGAWHGIIPPPPCAYCQSRRFMFDTHRAWPWWFYPPPFTTTFTTTYTNAPETKPNEAMRAEDV